MHPCHVTAPQHWHLSSTGRGGMRSKSSSSDTSSNLLIAFSLSKKSFSCNLFRQDLLSSTRPGSVAFCNPILDFLFGAHLQHEELLPQVVLFQAYVALFSIEVLARHLGAPLSNQSYFHTMAPRVATGRHILTSFPAAAVIRKLKSGLSKSSWGQEKSLLRSWCILLKNPENVLGPKILFYISFTTRT